MTRIFEIATENSSIGKPLHRSQLSVTSWSAQLEYLKAAENSEIEKPLHTPLLSVGDDRLALLNLWNIFGLATKWFKNQKDKDF